MSYQIVAHRINTISELKHVPNNLGIEIDLRDFGDSLVLSHDPFMTGEKFEDFLKFYNHAFLIVNIKSERIEEKVIDILSSYSIFDFFLLDSSFPMIFNIHRKADKKIALRFSEFESLETILNSKDMARWVWVDCFTKLHINKEIFKRLKEEKFKICIVSPDLQGRPEEIEEYCISLKEMGIEIDMVCVKLKNYRRWEEAFK